MCGRPAPAGIVGSALSRRSTIEALLAPATIHRIEPTRSSATKVSVIRRCPPIGLGDGDAPVGNVEDRIARDERCGVPVVPETEVYDIEDFGECCGVSFGGRLQIWVLDAHRMHRCRDMVEQGAGESGEVTSGVTSWRHPLVHLVDVDAVPFETGRGKRSEDVPGRSAAR